MHAAVRDLCNPCPRRRRSAPPARRFQRPRKKASCISSKHSPKLSPWQRELVRIVRKLAQYFYPQAQTRLMNEGWATFWHYTLISRLYEQGLVNVTTGACAVCSPSSWRDAVCG